ARAPAFGLSRVFAATPPPLHLTQSGVTMGTPLYMSPEQVEGKAVDPRTDIYSFGVTCYHLLSGQPPFRGQTAFEVAIQHVQKEPAPLSELRPDLPAEVCALVHRMMAKNPAERFQTGQDVVREVGRLRDNLVGLTGTLPSLTGDVPTAISYGPAPTPQPSDGIATQSLPRPGRSRRVLWLWLGSVVLAAAAGLGLGWLRSHNGTPATNPETPPEASRL